MSTSISITPRNLGNIALPSFCPKCFKILYHIKFHAPFTFGASIFGDSQACQEAIIGHYLEENGCLPKQFAPFCDCTSRTECSKHWSKFRYQYKSGVELYGSPDEVLNRKNGTLCIVDHKTAHSKGDEDPLHELYATQVIGYGCIAEGLGLGKVTKAGLLYWEAQVPDVLQAPGDHFEDGKLWMPFKPSGLEVEVDYSRLDPLIKELKKIVNSTRLPEGREGCKDCKKLELLLGVDQQYQAQDEYFVSRYGFDWKFRDSILMERSRRMQRRAEAFRELGESEDQAFSSDGMVSIWEFNP